MGEVEFSSGKRLKSALIIPFSPRKGFTAIHQNPKLGAAMGVVLVSAFAYSIACGFFSIRQHPSSGEFDFGRFALRLIYSLLHFAVLVVLSTIFMKGVQTSQTNYSAYVNVLAYWFAWRFTWSAAMYLFFSSHAVSGENLLYLVVSLVLFLWTLLLFVVVMSVINDVPLRRCWVLGFCTLIITSFLMSWTMVFLGAFASLF